MKVEIIKKGVSGFRDAWLVKRGDKYFIASGVVAFDTGQWEVLVFPADKDGKVTNWGEVAGGRGISHEDAIKELEEIEE